MRSRRGEACFQPDPLRHKEMTNFGQKEVLTLLFGADCGNKGEICQAEYTPASLQNPGQGLRDQPTAAQSARLQEEGVPVGRD